MFVPEVKELARSVSTKKIQNSDCCREIARCSVLHRKRSHWRSCFDDQEQIEMFRSLEHMTVETLSGSLLMKVGIILEISRQYCDYCKNTRKRIKFKARRKHNPTFSLYYTKR